MVSSLDVSHATLGDSPEYAPSSAKASCFATCTAPNISWSTCPSYGVQQANACVHAMAQAGKGEGPPGPQNEDRYGRAEWDQGENALIPTPPLLSPRAPATPRGVPQSPRSLACLPSASGPDQQQPLRCTAHPHLFGLKAKSGL